MVIVLKKYLFKIIIVFAISWNIICILNLFWTKYNLVYKKVRTYPIQQTNQILYCGNFFLFFTFKYLYNFKFIILSWHNFFYIFLISLKFLYLRISSFNTYYTGIYRALQPNNIFLQSTWCLQSYLKNPPKKHF